jgi:hypothetical protein
MATLLSLPGFDRHLCVVANRWGARSTVGNGLDRIIDGET